MLSEQDYTAIGLRGLMDSGWTNLAVANPWGLPGTNENLNSNFGGRIAEWGRQYVQKRLQGAPAAPWEENFQGRLFMAGVRDGINIQAAADQAVAVHGFASADLARSLTGVDAVATFQAAASAPTVASSSEPTLSGLGPRAAIGGLVAALVGLGLLVWVLGRKS